MCRGVWADCRSMKGNIPALRTCHPVWCKTGENEDSQQELELHQCMCRLFTMNIQLACNSLEKKPGSDLVLYHRARRYQLTGICQSASYQEVAPGQGIFLPVVGPPARTGLVNPYKQQVAHVCMLICLCSVNLQVCSCPDMPLLSCLSSPRSARCIAVILHNGLGTCPRSAEGCGILPS